MKNRYVNIFVIAAIMTAMTFVLPASLSPSYAASPDVQEVKGMDVLRKLEDKVRRYEQRQREKYFRYIQRLSRKEKARPEKPGKVEIDNALEVSVEERENRLVGNRRLLSFDVNVPVGLIRPNSVMNLRLYLCENDDRFLPRDFCAEWDYPLDRVKVSAMDSLKVITFTNDLTLKGDTRKYQVKALMYIQKGKKIYFQDTLTVASDRIWRPLHLLDMPVSSYVLNPDDFIVSPRLELRNTTTAVSLGFVPGSSRLDMSDKGNSDRLRNLKADISNILGRSAFQLKSIRISAYRPADSGADGRKLSSDRIEAAMELINSILPQNVRNRTYIQTKTVDVGRRDSLYDKRNSVLVEYVYESLRALSPDEILAKYESETAAVKLQYGLDEYRQLFSAVKDPDRLYDLYQRAYRESVAINGRPWPLAAGNLAAASLERGIADTTILSPLIDRACPVNHYVYKPDGSVKEVVNIERTVALQIMTYLAGDDYDSACSLLPILPDTGENRLLRAIVLCHGGYYMKSSSPAMKDLSDEISGIVSASSPVNKVVMYLAQDKAAFDRMAEQTLLTMTEESAKVQYLWAIVRSRDAQRSRDAGDMDSYCENFNAAVDFLVSAFRLDDSFIITALNEGDIPEDIVRDAVTEISDY